MIVLPYLKYVPQLDRSIQADDSVAVIGRAQVGPRTHLAPLTTLRADGESITVGEDCWFGEASTVHIADSVFGTSIGRRCTMGRFSLVHACSVGDDCIIGEHAVVMDGCEVGPGAVFAAGSVAPPGKVLPGGWLYAGIPAKPVEQVSAARLQQLHRALREGGAGGDVVRAAQPAGPLRHAPGTGAGRFSAPNAYVAPTAAIVGELRLAPHSSVWFGVEIDAEGGVVELGEASNIQDNTRITLKAGERVRIGRRVTVGHNVRMHACEIEDGVVIGMGSIIGPGTIVRTGAVVAAGAVTEPGTEVKAGFIWSGNPARESRPLSPDNAARFSIGVDVYKRYAEAYSAQARAPRA